MRLVRRYGPTIVLNSEIEVEGEQMSVAVSRPQIQAVLFDAAGVIQSTAEGWRDSLSALCGVPEAAEEFIEDVFAAEMPCLTGDGEFEAALGGVLGRWKSTASMAEALRVWELIEPSKELLEIVVSLQGAGVRVRLASNQQTIRALFMAEELGYGSLFDELFFSCRIGYAKPCTEYFNVVLTALNLDGRSGGGRDG